MKDYSLKINGQNYDVQIDEVNETSTKARVLVNGTPYEVEIAGSKGVAATKPQVAPAPKNSNYAPVKPAGAGAAVSPAGAAPAAGTIKCPLPGTVLAIKVNVGDTVAVGQTLLVLEAMKMENNIQAESAGVVRQILVQQGASVMEGDNLIVIG